MLVLSHADTHYLNRHMVGCGCHEILIQRWITVLFLSNFFLASIQLWFCRLSYSNHSFQLSSVQYSVHHFDPARYHQPCYQKLFSSTSNWRQAHLQRHIPCCNSNKAWEFIASTVYKVHSLAKSKALAVSRRSQKHLPNNSKYRAHILDRILCIILCLLLFRERCVVFSNLSSISDPMFECEWATNLFRCKLIDWWIRRGNFLRLGELRERKCFNSGRNWLDERLETYLICVSYWHGWTSLVNESWLFYSVEDWRMWQMWSRDMRISYPANVDQLCARNNPTGNEAQPEYWFCSSEFFSGRWSIS